VLILIIIINHERICLKMQRQKTWELQECKDSYQELIDSVESSEI